MLRILIATNIYILGPESLSNLRVSVPSIVLRGETTSFNCSWDMEPIDKVMQIIIIVMMMIIIVMVMIIIVMMIIFIIMVMVFILLVVIIILTIIMVMISALPMYLCILKIWKNLHKVITIMTIIGLGSKMVSWQF